MLKYEDVGEVLPFAKKFNYMRYKDIEAEPLEEQFRHATKDNIWPKPNCEFDDEFYDFLYKYVRASIRRRPRKKDEAAIEKFVNAVAKIRDDFDDRETGHELLEWYKDNWMSLLDMDVFYRRVTAEKYSPTWMKYLREKKRSKRQRPPRAILVMQEKTPRIGVEHRKGNVDLLPEEVLKAFNLKGIQFGNWITQDERVALMDELSDAFHDLGLALGIEKVDFKGRLGIALGSQGAGKADAHYNDTSKTINLTRKKGYGALAHELGHFFDNWLAEKFGSEGFLSDYYYQPNLESMEKILEVLYDKDSEYYKVSYFLDTLEHRSRPYWSCPVEMFARAFSQFVHDKLKENGCRNDFLANEPVFRICGKEINPAPTGEERLKLNRLFEELAKDIGKLLLD